MKVSELIKTLKKNGCRLIRHGANHDVWESTINGARFTVPRHSGKEMPVKTAMTILKQAGIERRY